MDGLRERDALEGDRGGVSPLNFGLMCKLWMTRELHVGTYETAIENMLRRMHDEAEAQSVFYLHRVALRVGADQISTLPCLARGLLQQLTGAHRSPGARP